MTGQVTTEEVLVRANGIVAQLTRGPLLFRLERSSQSLCRPLLETISVRSRTDHISEVHGQRNVTRAIPSNTIPSNLHRSVFDDASDSNVRDLVDESFERNGWV